MRKFDPESAKSISVTLLIGFTVFMAMMIYMIYKYEKINDICAKKGGVNIESRSGTNFCVKKDVILDTTKFIELIK